MVPDPAALILPIWFIAPASLPMPTSYSSFNFTNELPKLEGYDLIEEIGRGGMGVVFEAFQQSTGRRVAVKFMIESDAAGEQARHRFEREVELVARLQHQHIVSVLDSGVNRGRYFYVLEFIEGVPLDSYLVPGECEVRKAVALIASIAEAVDYAHQRGVLHRDLKPSNILIDSRGEPHILDFGLAKAIDPASKRGVDMTLSSPGQIIGTLGYMSPEQSRGQYGQMSVRSDVYSLGALMYQVLTGTLPCPIDGPLSDVLRGIAETEPPMASTIRKGLGADIDAILFKTLEKGPHRRYATAGEFAADLHRFLKQESVMARPPSKLVNISKFILRNKAVSAVVTLATVIIITGTIVYMVNLHDALKSSEAKAAFYADSIGLLNTAEGAKLQTLLTSLVDSSLAKLDERLGDHPADQATVRITLGDILLTLNRWPEALEQFDKCLATRKELFGSESGPAAEAMLRRARSLTWLGRAQSGAEQDHLLTEACKVYEHARTIREKLFGPRSEGVAECLHELGSVYRDRKDYERAEPLLTQALELRVRLHGDGDWLVAATRNGLAILYMKQNRLAEARDLFDSALNTLRSLPKADQKPLFEARTLQSFAECLLKLDDLDGAEAKYREAMRLKQTWFDENSLTIAKTLYGLGEVALKRHDLHSAEVFANQALAIQHTSSDADATHDLITRIKAARAATPATPSNN